jgi:hypothetical protein
MKKIMVIAASMFLASCGGSSESPVSTDSTVVDSITVSIDSVAVADSSVGAAQGNGDITGGSGQSPHGVPVK